VAAIMTCNTSANMDRRGWGGTVTITMVTTPSANTGPQTNTVSRIRAKAGDEQTPTTMRTATLQVTGSVCQRV